MNLRPFVLQTDTNVPCPEGNYASLNLSQSAANTPDKPSSLPGHSRASYETSWFLPVTLWFMVPQGGKKGKREGEREGRRDEGKRSWNFDCHCMILDQSEN